MKLTTLTIQATFKVRQLLIVIALTLSSSVNAAPPSITIDTSNLSYTENMAMTQVGPASTLTDSDGDTDWGGGSLVIQITANNESSDEISIPDNVVGAINTSGTDIRDNITVIGTLSSNEGTVTNGTALTITFNASATNALVQQVLQGISYRNVSDDPSASNRTITFTATDKNAESANGTQTIMFTVLNDQPTLSSTRDNPTFTEGDNAVSVFSSSSISTIESGQTLNALTLTIMNVNDGTPLGTDETIFIDGNAISLTDNNNGTTLTNNLTYNVSLSDNTATLSLTAGNLSETEMQLLIDSMTYINLSESPDESDRVVTLTQLVDSGSSSGGNVNSSTLALASTIMINAVNDVPIIIIDDTLTTDEDNNQSLTFTFTDVDGDTISATVTTQANNGVASVSGTTISYTPNANFNGSDSFTLTLTDSAGYTTAQAITVTVNSVNDEPTITIENALTTDEDNNQSLTFTFSDVDGDTVSATVTSQASNGVASVSGTMVNYVPNANFNGSDTFTLTLTDSAGYSTTQAITVTVNSVNDEPTITIENTLTTDEDNNQSLTFTFSDVDGDTVSATVTTQANHGVASVSGTTVSYTPDANFNGSDSFTLTLTDNAGYTTTQAISVTVNSSNDEPSITIDSTLTTDEDNNQNLTFTFNDVDGDTVSATVSTQASHGVASVSGTTISYVPDANFNGSDSFTLTLTDGAGYTTTQVISVTVNSVNDEPTITIDSTLTTDEDNNQSLTFTFSDIDGDTVSATVTTQANHGVASVSGTTVSYAPDANFNGSDSFTLTLTDGAGYTTTQVISVTVNSSNDAPTITIDNTLTTDEDNNQNLTFTFNDVDGDTVSATVSTQASHGVASVSGTTISYVPDANFNGSDSFTLTLTDGAGYTTTQVISVTVNSVNDEPTITIDSTLTTDEDNNQSLTFTFSDIDGDTVSATVTSQASNGVASVSGTTISYVPDANFNGSDSFTLTLTDSAGYSTTQVISVTVNSVNDEPTITIDSTLITNEDNTQSLIFTFSDVDGDTVSATVSTQANHGVASVSGTTVSYAPDADFNGSDSFTLTLTDSAGYTTTQVISVTVNSSNDEPTITIDNTLTTDEDNNQNLTFTFSDADGDTVSASVSTQANHGVASVSGTTISYVPDTNFNGSDSFTLTLTDNAGYSTTQVISVTVNSVNDEPTITIDNTLTTDEDNNQSLTFTFSDVDGDTVSASVSTQANYGVASVNGTTVSYAPDANFNGSDSFTLTLTDSAGYTTTQVISVTVNSSNDDPTITIDNTLTTDEDNNQNLTFSFSDVDGDTVSATVTTQASHGVASVSGTTISYAPDTNFNGSDNFTLTLTDSAGYTTTQTISVTVNSVNDAPSITIDSTLITSEDNTQSLTFTFSDVDGDTVSATVTTQANHGVASVSGTTVSYAPDANFNGSDSFTLSLTDNAGYTTMQIISVTVNSSNDEPTITIDSTLTTDEDNNQTLTFTFSDVDGDTVSATVSTQANHGVASVSGTTVSYAPDANYNGSDSFILTLTDNAGYSTTQAISVTVNSVNDVPTITIDSTLTTDEDNNQNLTFTFSDVDGDTVSATVSTQATNGVASVSGTTVSYAPNTNFNGTDSFTLTLTDNAGYTTTQAITVTVNSINDVPTITIDSTLTTDEDNNQSLTFTFSDVDGDTVSASVTSQASNGVASVSGTTVSYAPDANFNGNDSFTLTLTDNAGYSTTQAISVTVNSVNDEPTITIASTLTTDEDNNQSLTFTFSDVDGDIVSATVTTQASNGVASVSGTTVSYAPDTDFNGNDSFTLTLTDSAGYTTTQVITVTVNSVNDDPTITIENTLTTDEDNNQNLTFTYSDVDGDTVSATVSTQAKHGFAIVIGTTVSYAPETNFNGSDSFTLTLTGSDGFTTTQTITVTVNSVNDEPMITIASTLTTDEDNNQILTFTYSDVDGDTVSAVESVAPVHGTITITGTSVLYSPDANFNGSDSFTLTLTDSAGFETNKTIIVNVDSVNDIPIAVDDQLMLDVTADNLYQIDILANDISPDGDSLTLIGVSASIGEALIENNKLVYQAPIGTEGTIEFSYAIKDIDAEIVTAKVLLQLQPALPSKINLTLPDDVTANASGLFTQLDLGSASAVDPSGKVIPLSIENGNALYPTGNSIVHWKADDGEGNSVMLSQRVKVNPLISIDKDQKTAEGSETVIAVHLNGIAPDYPVRVAYNVSGTADSSDHNLTDGELVIEEGTTGLITFTVYEDAVADNNETIVVSLSSDLNLGYKSEHTLTIIEGNIAPKVTLQISQADEQRSLVTNNNELVKVHAVVSDANPDNTHRIEWSTTHDEIPVPGPDQNEFSFDPSVLTPGIYKLTARVIDNGAEPLETTQDVYIEVVTTLALLRSVDSDGDLIPDNQEGYIDTDGDGIADYLDAISECNVLQEQALVSKQYLIEAEPGICLRKGITIAGNETGGSQLLQQELLVDDEMTNIGGLFDFLAYDLKTPGQNITLVIPQRLPIPEGAVYRKLRNGQWSDFVEDENNIIRSTAGQPGYCPPPNHPTWTAGLSLGHWCVQLTIQDGGTNDDDGRINSTIVDPGGIAISSNDNHAPVATADTITVKWNTSIEIDVLSNDTDEDDDLLSISAATVDYGEVSFENSQLVYTTSDIFFGQAVIQYSITDQNGGAAHSSVAVQVVNNFAPVAFGDTASTDDRGTVNIDVLSNDIDADGDQLTITEVTAEHGDVVINADQTLTYSAQSGFDGLDTITYTIVDEKSATAQGTVIVTVTAFVIAEVKNSSGGSMGIIIFLLTSIVILRRNIKIAVSLLLAVIFSVHSQASGVEEQSQWLFEAEYGYAQADDNESLDEIPAENIESIDSEDNAWSIGVGYLLTPEWKIVGRFIDLGTGSVTLKAETLDPDEYHQSAAKATPLLVRGFAVDVSYQLFNFASIVSDATVGTILWERDVESTYQGNSIKRYKSGTDMYLGLQLGYQLTNHWQLGGSYNRYFISENGIDNFNVRVTYRF